MTEPLFAEIISLTEELIRLPEFRRLHRAICAVLRFVDELDGDELERIKRDFEAIENTRKEQANGAQVGAAT